MSNSLTPYSTTLTGQNGFPTPTPQEQEALDRLNLMSVDPLFRLLKEDDMIPTGINPSTGDATVSLEGTVSAALWKALVDLVKLVLRASHTVLGAEIRPEYLERVGLDVPPVIPSVTRFLTTNNPLGYSISRLQAEWNFYTAQNMLNQIVGWMSICQYRCQKLIKAGLDPLWAWTPTLTEGTVPPPDSFMYTIRPLGPGTTMSYDPRLPGFDPRLIEESVTHCQELVVHPTLSHYASHHPGFDAFTRNPMQVVTGCTGDAFCLEMVEDRLARMDIRED
ncbi:hypothetical protein EV360DRAFT_89575 [Lentinula raphanica]|nr:hypothetical protein EV360DRAFT_89575 [Lentinula raphanica]